MQVAPPASAASGWSTLPLAMIVEHPAWVAMRAACTFVAMPPLYRIDDVAVLDKGARAAFARHTELIAVQPNDVIQVVTQQLDHAAIVTPLHDPIMKIEITLALEIGVVAVAINLFTMLHQQSAQVADLCRGHVLRGEPCGHSLQRLTHMEDLEQLLAAHRDHPRTDVRTSYDQPTRLQSSDRLTQWATADTVGTCQFRFA